MAWFQTVGVNDLRTSENCLVMVLITMEMGWLESCRYVGAHASELLLEVKTHRERASARQLVCRSLTSLSLCSEESPVLRRSCVRSKLCASYDACWYKGGEGEESFIISASSS